MRHFQAPQIGKGPGPGVYGKLSTIDWFKIHHLLMFIMVIYHLLVQNPTMY